MSDAAIANIVTGLVTITTIIIGFLTLWIRLKYGLDKVDKKTGDVEKKLDDNTTITKMGTAAAVVNATAAADSAAQAKSAVDVITRKLNGGVDNAIAEALAPVRKVLEEHAGKIDELGEYVHKRNHDMLTALQINNNKLETILFILKQKEPGGHQG